MEPIFQPISFSPEFLEGREFGPGVVFYMQQADKWQAWTAVIHLGTFQTMDYVLKG